MKPQPRNRRPLLPLAVAGGILLLGAAAVSIASDRADAAALWAGVIGVVLLVVGLAVRARP